MAYQVCENNGEDPSWPQFREEFLDKYQNTAVRSVLRQKLRAIKYEGVRTR